MLRKNTYTKPYCNDPGGYPALSMFFFSVAILLFSSLFNTVVAQFTDPAPQSLPYYQDFNYTPGDTGTDYPAGWQGSYVMNAIGTNAYVTVAPVADANDSSHQNLLTIGDAGSMGKLIYNYDSKIGYLDGTAAGGTNYGLILAINTTGLSNIVLTYDIGTISIPFNSNTNGTAVQYRTSTGVTPFTTIPGTEYKNATLPLTDSGTTLLSPQTITVTLPSACDNQPVVELRWISTKIYGTVNYPSIAIDNVSVNSVPAGIEAPGLINSISIYPNPARNHLMVTGRQLTGGKTKIEFYNVLEEKMLSSLLSFEECQDEALDVSGLAPGIYFVKVKQGECIYVNKIIKQ
jgi:hypothetical protein